MSDSDAHRAQSITPARPLQLPHGGCHQSCAAGTQGMAQRKRSSVGIDVRSVIGNSQLAKHCQRLRGERFVEFDHIHIGDVEPGQREHLARGWNWTHAHDARRNPCCRRGHHARLRRQAKTLGRVFRSQQQRAGAIINARSVAGGDSAGGLDYRR